MRYILSIFLLFTSFTDPVTRIARVNELKRDAKEAMEAQSYVQAVFHYITLVDSMLVDDDNLKMNMASAAYNLSYAGQDSGLKPQAGQQDDIELDTSDIFNADAELKFAVIAENKYLELVNSEDKTIASSAYNQRGIIAFIQSEQEKEESTSKDELFSTALDHLKNALRNDPTNDAARYNYELLKKIKREREQQKNEDVKPSEYAKSMKLLADSQRQKGKFKDALQTMMEALERDETAKAYEEYITKLKVVASI